MISIALRVHQEADLWTRIAWAHGLIKYNTHLATLARYARSHSMIPALGRAWTDAALEVPNPITSPRIEHRFDQSDFALGILSLLSSECDLRLWSSHPTWGAVGCSTAARMGISCSERRRWSWRAVQTGAPGRWGAGASMHEAPQAPIEEDTESLHPALCYWPSARCPGAPR